MSHDWSYPGARWWKFDFHTHTPASLDTRAWQKARGTPKEITPEAWLLKYMAAEIDCVAITDHNTGEWVDKLKTAYAEMKAAPPDGFRDLYLFPGVEISVHSGIHILAVFDPEASSTDISNLLAKVGYEGTHGDSDGVTRSIAAEVVKAILNGGGIPIPAHVENAKGLLQFQVGTRKCLLDANSTKQVLQEPGLLALEWSSFDSPKPQLLAELKLNFTSVVGSDCHTFQGSGVPGSRYTWIKMAKPNLEAVRLALLDGQGISVRRSDESADFEPLGTPEHFIEKIEIQDARYMGRRKQPSSVPFNPYFNALIGGRGTGKSTIVHALRLAYNRKDDLPTTSGAGQTFERFNKTATPRSNDGGLQAETIIRIEVQRHGTRYRLTWQQNAQEHVVDEWNAATGNFIPSISQAVTKQRFPLGLFSQGQIAELAGDSQQALLKVIDDSAGTESQRTAFEDALKSFLVIQARIRELEGKLQGRDSLELSLQDVQRKLAQFENVDSKEILKNYQRVRQQELELKRQLEAPSELATRLKALAAELLTETLPAELFNAERDVSAVNVVEALHAAIFEAQQKIVNTAAALEERGKVLRNELDASSWLAGAVAAKTAYDKLTNDLQQQGVNGPSDYDRLVQQKLLLEAELKKSDSLQKQDTELRENAAAQLEQVQSCRRGISAQRSEFLRETLEGNLYVRIALIPYSRDAHAIERSLRELLGVVDGRFADDLYQEPDGSTPKGLIADLLDTVAQVERSGAQSSATFEQALQEQLNRLSTTCRGEAEFGGRFNKFLQAEAGKRPEFIDRLMCWFPEDGLRVEYSRKGDGKDFQSIGHASAGQRAAAMLAFLLAHGDEPLVLDQPEDDLDNHLIYGLIVQQIRTNKQRRQLIIVTHNPNIVVNGDAELIHVMDFNGQCHVKQSGSLQDQDTRIEVCKVMEGGREAFERRYLRLGKEQI